MPHQNDYVCICYLLQGEWKRKYWDGIHFARFCSPHEDVAYKKNCLYVSPNYNVSSLLLCSLCLCSPDCCRARVLFAPTGDLKRIFCAFRRPQMDDYVYTHYSWKLHPECNGVEEVSENIMDECSAEWSTNWYERLNLTYLNLLFLPIN